MYYILYTTPNKMYVYVYLTPHSPPPPRLIVTCFVNPMYGATTTLFYPIRSQNSRNLQQSDLGRSQLHVFTVRLS